MTYRTAVSLSDEEKGLVEKLLETGRFSGISDVVASGLRLLEERERDAEAFIAGLESEIADGLKSGEPQAMEPARQLLSRFRGHRHLA